MPQSRNPKLKTENPTTQSVGGLGFRGKSLYYYILISWGCIGIMENGNHYNGVRDLEFGIESQGLNISRLVSKNARTSWSYRSSIAFDAQRSE